MSLGGDGQERCLVEGPEARQCRKPVEPGRGGGGCTGAHCRGGGRGGREEGGKKIIVVNNPVDTLDEAGERTGGGQDTTTGRDGGEEGLKKGRRRKWGSEKMEVYFKQLQGVLLFTSSNSYNKSAKP